MATLRAEMLTFTILLIQDQPMVSNNYALLLVIITFLVTAQWLCSQVIIKPKWCLIIVFHIGRYGGDFSPYTTRRLYFSSEDSIDDLKCIPISINDDTKVENEVEYFYLTIFNGARATVHQGQRRIRINIHDNDGIILLL